LSLTQSPGAHARGLDPREIDVCLVDARVLRVGKQRVGRGREVVPVIVEVGIDVVDVDALEHDAHRSIDGRGRISGEDAHGAAPGDVGLVALLDMVVARPQLEGEASLGGFLRARGHEDEHGRAGRNDAQRQSLPA
jgi:hypothetical protein